MTPDAGSPRTTHGIVLESDWIVPVASPAIPGGFVVAIDGFIEYLGPELPTRYQPLPRVRLENTAILPGWVNSHCHLEFSDLKDPIPSQGTFDQWLAHVLLQRSAIASLPAEQRLSLRRSAIQQGLTESWRCGVRWIVDNVTSPWDAAWISQWQSETRRSLPSRTTAALVPGPLVSVQPCFELLDTQAHRWEQTSTFAFEQLDAPKSEGVAPGGMAPHAPYTASLQVTRRAAQWSQSQWSQSQRSQSQWSQSQQGLVSMHLAETREELRWLDERSGPLGDWIAPKTDANHRLHLGVIDEHLTLLASCWRSLVVHGNYLNPRQIEFLSMHRDRMAVVICPRTHAWFQHGVHPMNRLRSHGVPVLIGTDSRASNPNLNLWEEVRCLAAGETGEPTRPWLDWASVDAAAFLALPRGIGRLQVGGVSQLTAVRWERQESNDGSCPRSEKELIAWMLKSGHPYPLETDGRLTSVAASV